MPSELQQVAERLLACLNEAPRAVGYLHDRARKCREAAAWIGNQGNNPNARMAAAQLDDAARRCEEAAHYLSLAEARAKQWVEQMVSGVRTAEPSGSPSRPDAAAGRDQPADSRRGDDPSQPEANKGRQPKDPQPGSFDPEPVLQKLPKRVVTRGYSPKTRGIWVDDHGNEHNLISGRHDPEYQEAQRYAERLGLVTEPHKLSTAADVELKFAMRMRREDIRRARIVLNNRPCPGELGCDELLPRFLPRGSELVVYGPDGFEKIYHGETETS
ncbi:DddA-like double-stranded DNA deaminase toxin [Kribbella sp. WER1]